MTTHVKCPYATCVYNSNYVCLRANITLVENPETKDDDGNYIESLTCHDYSARARRKR